LVDKCLFDPSLVLCWTNWVLLTVKDNIVVVVVVGVNFAQIYKNF
jgi:hypothetical protein